MHTILRHEAILHICDFGHWVSMGYKCDFTHLLFLVLREPTCNECNELLIGGEKKWNFRWRCYTLKRCNISTIGKRRINWKLRLSNLDKMCTDIFEGIWVSVNYDMVDDLMFLSESQKLTSQRVQQVADGFVIFWPITPKLTSWLNGGDVTLRLPLVWRWIIYRFFGYWFSKC